MEEREELRAAEPEAHETPAQTEQPEHKPVSIQEGRDRTRRNIMHTVCGVYLAYLAYKLAAGLPELVASGGWKSSSAIISLAGTIVFTVTAVLLLVNVVRRVIREAKEAKETKEENE